MFRSSWRAVMPYTPLRMNSWQTGVVIGVISTVCCTGEITDKSKRKEESHESQDEYGSLERLSCASVGERGDSGGG